MPATIPQNKQQVSAYQTIRHFFDIYVLDDAICYLHSLLKAAATRRVWKKSYPYSAMHYMQQLEKLCSAAFYIHNHHATLQAAVISPEQRADNPPMALLQACTGHRMGENFWTCFPRHLLLQQLYDPYLAIKGFCSYKTKAAWAITFADILEYALAGRSINEAHPPYHLLNVQRHLSRLIEACHLLELRGRDGGK